MARRWPKDLAWARVVLEVDNPWCDRCGHRMYVCDHRHHRIFTLTGNAVKDFYSVFLASARLRFCFSCTVRRRSFGSPSGFLSGFAGR